MPLETLRQTASLNNASAVEDILSRYEDDGHKSQRRSRAGCAA